MLHITNGDSAAETIRRAGVPGAVLPWRDVLHDGPVPGDVSFAQLRAIRARFIADNGWRTQDESLREFTERDLALERALSNDEIVLWFEHDLYDQLQLLQLLDWFATCELGATVLSLVCDAEYLGESTSERLAERFPARRRVSAAELSTARRAWSAFRSADPTTIESFLRDDSSPLPFVAPALLRHLEQFPSTRNGLSRTEAQALEVLATGAAKLGDVYVASHHKREDPIFLGDSSFATYMVALSNVPTPLVLAADGSRVGSSSGRALWETRIDLTPAGRDVLAGALDHVTLNGIDRWYGGVHLEGHARWRWDTDANRIRVMST